MPLQPGTLQGPFGCSGGVAVNLPELTWLISCSMVADHYLFQCVIAMFFGYLRAVGEGKHGYRKASACKTSSNMQYLL